MGLMPSCFDFNRRSLSPRCVYRRAYIAGRKGIKSSINRALDLFRVYIASYLRLLIKTRVRETHSRPSVYRHPDISDNFPVYERATSLLVALTVFTKKDRYLPLEFSLEKKNRSGFLFLLTKLSAVTICSDLRDSLAKREGSFERY